VSDFWLRILSSMVRIQVVMLPLLAAQGQPQPSLNASVKPFEAVDFSRRFISKARRLTNTMPKSATLCKSKCWNNMQKGLIDMADTMSKNNCVSNPCEGDGRRLAGYQDPPVFTKFMGMCGKDDVCKATKWPAACKDNDTYVLELKENFDMGDKGDACLIVCDPCMEAILPAPSGSGVCTGLSSELMCKGMCSDECKNDPAMAPMFAVEKKKVDPTDAEPVDQPDADQECQDMSSSDELVAGYNMMCMENKEDPNDTFYCTARAQEWVDEKGAFKSVSPSTEFPKLCDTDCDTVSAKAIKDLGCCAAGYVDLMERMGAPVADIRAMEAVISVCSDTTVEICDGTVMPTVILRGKKTMKEDCPANPEETKTQETGLDENLGTKALGTAVQAIGCSQTAVCPKGRRLSSTNDLLYKVKLTAATDAELKVKQHALESNANFVKADVPGAGGASNAGTSSSSTSTPSMSSCNRMVPVAVFVAAWLGPLAL